MAWYRKACHVCVRGSRRHPRSLRPRNGGWLIALGALCLLGALVRPAGAQTCPNNETPYSAAFNFDQYTGSQPFTLNTCPTTMSGPPWANVVTSTDNNFLGCTNASQPIALCYYSGPAGPAPCELAADGATATCTCYVIPAGQQYSVYINAILNLDVYNSTSTSTLRHEAVSRSCPAETHGTVRVTGRS